MKCCCSLICGNLTKALGTLLQRLWQPLPRGSGTLISTRFHNVTMNIGSLSLGGTGLSLPLYKALWEGQKLVGTTGQLYHYNASYKRYVRYSVPTKSQITLWPPNQRKSHHHCTSPTSLLYLYPNFSHSSAFSHLWLFSFLISFQIFSILPLGTLMSL